MQFLYQLNPKRQTGEGAVTAEMFYFLFSDDHYISLLFLLTYKKKKILSK